MPRGGARDFLGSVLSSVNNEPKSVLEIANSSKKSWESTKRALELLESLGVIQSKREGDRKLFFRNEITLKSSDNETFFDVPLEVNDDNLINFIFETARKTWKKKTGRDIGKTQMQKVLVRANNTCGLNLPVGRYLYGMICVKPYEPSENYAYRIPENGQQITAAIDDAVEKYGQLTIMQLKLLHYRETGNALYEAKEESASLLTSSNFGKYIFSNFCMSLSKIIVNLPHDNELLEYFTEFIGAVNNIAQLDESGLIQSKNDIVDAFNEMWELIATKLFYVDLSKKYSPQELAKIKFEIKNHLFIVNEEISKLNEYLASKEYPNCPEFEDLKKLLGSVKIEKILEEKELHKLAEESAKNPSDIFGEFGLN